ncbi:hypothetical protein LZ30DRAFT_734709 [Colletotrichum cereale]|nr:hypothetical protein LZ30DRAFT_734709 [Colletotrichum cereale]
MFGAGAGGSRSFGFFGCGGGGGGGGTSFEGVFGSPGHLSCRTEYDPGTGFGFEDQEDVRRGGAGMTWAEFTELFRHRYAGGPPSVDLFDGWDTDW